MNFIEFIQTYRRQVSVALFIGIIFYTIGVRLQEKYNLYNGWFVCLYMLLSMYIPRFIFYLITK